jgi:hypothetical protein
VVKRLPISSISKNRRELQKLHISQEPQQSKVASYIHNRTYTN